MSNETKASNEFILLSRKELKALIRALQRAEEALATQREPELELRMQRMRLEQKWRGAGHKPTFLDSVETPPGGTPKDSRRDE